MVHLFNKDLRGSQSKQCRPTTHSSEVSVGSMQNYHNHRDWVSVKGGLTFCCPGLWRPSASHSHPQRKSPLHFSRCLQIPGQMKPFLWGATQGHSSSGGHTIPPFTVAWLWNFTGDGRNGRHSILLPPSDVTHQPEEERDSHWEWFGRENRK